MLENTTGLPDCVNSTAQLDEDTGYPSVKGYGHTHELVVVAKQGRGIRQGYVPCHLCGNRRCINPKHVSEVRVEDFNRMFGSLLNAEDPYANKRGDKNPNTKLDYDSAMFIKQLHDNNVPQRGIAAQLDKTFNISLSQQNISRIIRTRAWEHYHPPTSNKDTARSKFDELIEPVVVDAPLPKTKRKSVSK